MFAIFLAICFADFIPRLPPHRKLVYAFVSIPLPLQIVPKSQHTFVVSIERCCVENDGLSGSRIRSGISVPEIAMN